MFFYLFFVCFFTPNKTVHMQCTAVPFRFHVVLATFPRHISQDHFMFFLSISVLLCHRPLCHKWHYIAIFLWLFAMILLQRWKQMIIARRLIVAVCWMSGFLQWRNHTTCKLIFWPINICLKTKKLIMQKKKDSDFLEYLFVSDVIANYISQFSYTFVRSKC